MGITDRLIVDLPPEFLNEKIDDQRGLQLTDGILVFISEIGLHLLNEGLMAVVIEFEFHLGRLRTGGRFLRRAIFELQALQKITQNLILTVAVMLMSRLAEQGT